MNVSELFHLTTWVQTNIVDPAIPGRYQALLGVLQQNMKPDKQQQSFEGQRDTLIVALTAVPLTRLTSDQLRFLDDLSILPALGQAGVDAVEDVLYKNVIDVATAAQKIDQILKRLNAGLAKSAKIRDGLTGCIPSDETLPPGEVLVRVAFTGDAAILNAVDLRKWSDDWYHIARGIAMAHGRPAEEIRVVGATKGSIVIELAMMAIAAKSIGTIVKSALEVVERAMKLRKMSVEIRNLDLQNEKLAKEIEESAEQETAHGVTSIAGKISAELGLKAEDSQGEQISALGSAVERLVGFIQKHGEVDLVEPESDAEPSDGAGDADNGELRTLFEEIRRLKTATSPLLLEAPDSSDSDDIPVD